MKTETMKEENITIERFSVATLIVYESLIIMRNYVHNLISFPIIPQLSYRQERKTPESLKLNFTMNVCISVFRQLFVKS